MECEKCQDLGFIEHNAGLLVEFCDCEIGKQVSAKQRAIYGIPEEIDDSGTGQPDTVAGSTDTSKPKQPRKHKKKKRARKRAS